MNKKTKTLFTSILVSLALFLSTSQISQVHALSKDTIASKNNIKLDLDTIGNITLDNLNFNEDSDSYIFDIDGAIADGLTQEQALNAKNVFESFSIADARQFEEIRKSDTNGKVVGAITSVSALIAALAAIGATWLVNEILNFGIRAACKKWGNSWNNSPGIFKTFCKTMGYV
ncbi:MAG: hypothetical protein ACRCX2_23220 [Paraclostridium sp.]